ncbi:ABC transporter transmembrane domain-containing protein [Limnobacter sp.]|uniref:ABC transporter transmembrane domain-containing protein n=1 Tax=Limnobacter sp. TaxID=2003368 RepID=UPI00258AA70E|nr:ABC transporter transmembrane domain-containing protein [Limnobacter sp.]
MKTDKPYRSLRTTLSSLLTPHKGWAFSALLALLVGSAMSLSLPLMFRRLIDSGYLSGQKMDGLNAAFGVLLLLVFTLAVASATRYYLVTTLGERVSTDLRTRVYSHLLVQRPEFFESLKVGEVLSRLTADTTLIQTLIGSSMSFALRNGLTTIGGLIMLILTSPKLSSAVLVLVVVVLVPVIILARRVRSLSRTSQDKLADSSAIAQEVLNNITIVQAFNQEHRQAEKFSLASELTYAAAKRRTVNRSGLMFVAIGLAFAGLIVVLWMGANDVAKGVMSSGELAQFVMYAAFVGGGFAALSEVLGEFQRAAGAAERLIELLNLNTTLRRTGDAPPQAVGGFEIEFKNVEFRYPSAPDRTILKNFSLKIPRGETVAIVGPSGAGKSTLFNLLLRWYDLTSGEILIENQPLQSLHVDQWRARCAYVSQEAVVFSGSLGDNIRYGNPAASDSDVLKALDDAAATTFVNRLPDGIQTEVGEKGVRLSGGERQRVSIARAILRNASLLLLDEATASLDAESERLVQTAIERSRHGRTTLIIAHRLATVMAADRIVVMNEGEIVETGTHKSLVAQNGLYAKLASLQFIDEAAEKTYDSLIQPAAQLN